MAATTAAIRLYVGGIGERVTETDIRTTFGNIGSVQTVDIIRTKGRSFAYIDFLPLSDNSVPKLFSTYNGCSWKGGKLKLEKAKPHYIDRLKQEWAEDAELKNNEDAKDSVVDESMVVSPQPMTTLELEKMQFRLFFPKLRKVKALSMRGTGKHKYSFQRVQVPPLPRLFCDCPEHCDPVETPKVTRVHNSDIQSDTMNDEEVNMMNSVMDRLLNKGTSTQRESFQPSREDQGHDSQDGGMNDEEINIMNSVMKKLLDRETAKTQRKHVHESSQMSVPTVELEETVNNMNEESEDDDDDIKINVGSGKNIGYDNWETSLVNKMAGSNEQRTSDAAKNKPDIGIKRVKPLTNKRKSVLDKSDDKDLASPVNRKRARLETQSNEVEEHLELKGVQESETKKSGAGGMWSQKSSWKELIGGGKSGSFQLSNIKPSGQTNDVEALRTDGETSSDEEIERLRNVKNEHKPSIITSSDKVDFESVRNLVSENVDTVGIQTNDVEALRTGGEASSDEEIERLRNVKNEHKPSTITSSDKENFESVRNMVSENVDTVGIQTVQPPESSEGLDKVARGSSWLQKSSWTQLVGGGNSSSFSISQILPGDVLEKQQFSKPRDDSTSNNLYSSGAFVNEQRMSENASGGARGSRFGFRGRNKKKEVRETDGKGIQLNEAPKGNDSSALSMTKKSEIEKKVANSQAEVGFGETCLFMRSDDSLKEWQNAKAALTKKRNNQ